MLALQRTTHCTAVADIERDALAGLSAAQIAGFHAVITTLQEART